MMTLHNSCASIEAVIIIFSVEMVGEVVASLLMMPPIHKSPSPHKPILFLCEEKSAMLSHPCIVGLLAHAHVWDNTYSYHGAVCWTSPLPFAIHQTISVPSANCIVVP